ncbi:MAG: ABC transporter permease [Propionivibrio sp.]
MFWRIVGQSWRRNPRRRLLAVLTVFLAAGLVSALMAVSIDVGDKMARELKSYGANILIEPAGQAALPALFGEQDNPLSGQDFLDEKELPLIKDIFWRNNIVGFAPLLSGVVHVVEGKEEREVGVLGTFFDQPLAVPDEDDFHTGQRIISPYWTVQGEWPVDGERQALAGRHLAERAGWQVGSVLTLAGPGGRQQITISGILATGGEEETSLVMPLARAQELLDLPGKVQTVRVSALTVPETQLSRKARRGLDSLDAEEYDLWYCTAYVSSIAHQLAEAVSGAAVRPIWQVAASEGAVIRKIQLLLAVVTLAALVASAMGIASLMTSTIMERAREIGLMKALGARPWQILLVFYTDAVLAGLLGGALGCLAGWVVARAIGQALFGTPLGFAWIVVPCVLLLSALIAVCGTWLPARRIARLYPVEVLYGRR